MGFTVGLALLNRQAAEPEVFGCGVADRPFAGPFCQFHQGQFFCFFLDGRNLCQGLGADFICRWLWRQWLTGGNNLLARGQRFDGRGVRAALDFFLRPVAQSVASAFGAGSAALGAGFALASAFGAAFGFVSALVVEVARLDRPKRCTFPMTALRVTPPNSLAIWLADCPSPHIFLSNSTRSSVQDIS